MNESKICPLPPASKCGQDICAWWDNTLKRCSMASQPMYIESLCDTCEDLTDEIRELREDIRTIGKVIAGVR